MLNFLKNSRSLLNSKKHNIALIFGNESCDLDSAVCALSLAYFYHKYPPKHATNLNGFLPVLNIAKMDYALKTEVFYLLQKYDIKEEMLTFKDELQQDFMANCCYMLVDHHASPYADKSLSIFDHRPRDENVKFAKDCLVTMEIVGSCATLIAEQYLNNKPLGEDVDLLPLHLLRNTIVLDTINFSTEAGRATPKDIQVCQDVENLLPSPLLSREELFQNLVAARADISNLTPLQLLRKDMKMLSKNGINIAMPGFPLSVQQFIQKPQAEQHIREFAESHKCVIVLLMGLLIENDKVNRDLGLILINDKYENLKCSIKKSLEESKSLLNLQIYANCHFMQGDFFQQLNIKSTRKHILPMVEKCLQNAEIN